MVKSAKIALSNESEHQAGVSRRIRLLCVWKGWVYVKEQSDIFKKCCDEFAKILKRQKNTPV